MSCEIAVLRALLRLARRRTPPTAGELLVRVDADAPAIRRALGSLARAGLVQRTPAGPRLTLAGFAVAVATTAAVPAQRASKAPRTARARARVVPLVRRPAA